MHHRDAVTSAYVIRRAHRDAARLDLAVRDAVARAARVGRHELRLELAGARSRLAPVRRELRRARGNRLGAV